MGCASDDACDEAQQRMHDARSQCLVAIANHYGHPASAMPVDVLAAVNTLLRVSFDLGAEFQRASMIPPPPPTDAAVVTAAEELIRRLQRR